MTQLDPPSMAAPAPKARDQTSARRSEVLPSSLAPRGLSRVQAALYIGVGVTKFDEMVADGRMPHPKQVDSRKIWDRRRLDEAFEALPDNGHGETKSDTWNDVAV